MSRHAGVPGVGQREKHRERQGERKLCRRGLASAKYDDVSRVSGELAEGSPAEWKGTWEYLAGLSTLQKDSFEQLAYILNKKDVLELFEKVPVHKHEFQHLRHLVGDPSSSESTHTGDTMIRMTLQSC
eukprot:482166-Amphidinium_carterae.1